LHRSCTFANYQVTGDGQKKALSLAKSYAQNFGGGFASFVFSGAPGTGKTIWPPPSVTIFSLPGVPFWWSPFLT
jgi:integral membrane sensor domain MASE1